MRCLVDLPRHQQEALSSLSFLDGLSEPLSEAEVSTSRGEDQPKNHQAMLPAANDDDNINYDFSEEDDFYLQEICRLLYDRVNGNSQVSESNQSSFQVEDQPENQSTRKDQPMSPVRVGAILPYSNNDNGSFNVNQEPIRQDPSSTSVLEPLQHRDHQQFPLQDEQPPVRSACTDVPPLAAYLPADNQPTWVPLPRELFRQYTTTSSAYLPQESWKHQVENHWRRSPSEEPQVLANKRSRTLDDYAIKSTGRQSYSSNSGEPCNKRSRTASVSSEPMPMYSASLPRETAHVQYAHHNAVMTRQAPQVGFNHDAAAAMYNYSVHHKVLSLPALMPAAAPIAWVPASIPPNPATAKSVVGRWTDQEHSLFLQGLQMYGRGKWIQIAELIKTRTPAQVNTHAQKFFIRQLLPPEERMKRRKSINDRS